VIARRGPRTGSHRAEIERAAATRKSSETGCLLLVLALLTTLSAGGLHVMTRGSLLGDEGVFLTSCNRPSRQRVKVHTVVNFSNLAVVLAGRPIRGARRGLFLRPRQEATAGLDEDEFVRTFSPLVANQEPTRPIASERPYRVVEHRDQRSEIRDLPTA